MALSLAWGIDDTVLANDNEYQLNLEFSRVLRWYELWKDKELSEFARLIFSIVLIADIDWKNEPPSDLKTLCEFIPENDVIPLSNEIIKRIAGNQTANTTVKRDLHGNILEDEEKKWYDIEEDSGYIYSSFLFDYGMDLIQERATGSLHWDKFNHLLAGLSEDTKFKRVIQIRQMEIPKGATPSQTEEIRRAKKAVALKSDRAEIEFEMMDLKQKREFMEKQERGELNSERWIGSYRRRVKN